MTAAPADGEAEWSFLDRVWGEREPRPLDMAFGRWSLQLRGDELADLRFDGVAVARSVRAVARDRDWNTVPAEVVSVADAEDGLELRIRMHGLGADIAARVSVVADAQRLTVLLHATSITEFLSNRLGLVVLHPPELAGAALRVGSATGGTRRTVFPSAVSAHQPAMDIRSLHWSHEGVQITADFAGDVFEMEDQRNWTDASYKTYSTPLERPFPVAVAAGTVIEQSVEFAARRTVTPRRPTASGATDVVEFVDTGRPVPAVTLGASTGPTADVVDAPVPDGVAALLVELDTRTPTWRSALHRAALEARGVPLDVRIVADDVDSVQDAVAAAVSTAAISRFGVFSGETHVTEEPCWAALKDAARRLAPLAELVGGARSHFTELNRARGALPAGLPGVTFAMTPQMHAVERAQIVESVPMQAVVAHDAAAIAAGRPLHVGPITLRPRFNAVATGPGDVTEHSTIDDGYGPELVAGATDARQGSRALEPWTVASFAAVCSGATREPDGRLESVSYFEASGARGIRNSEEAFLAYRAIAAIAGLGGATLLVPVTPAPPGLFAIGARWPSGTSRVLVASLSAAAITVTVRHAGSERPVTVEPYAVVALDVEPASRP